MKMTMKSHIILVIALFFVSVAFLLTFFLISVVDDMPISNSPEQQEQAEVIAKRSKNFPSGDGGSGSTEYFITFKIPDGSLKEFGLGMRKKTYDAIYEGETGILTYKERADIEEEYGNEDMRFEGREFICFEKDPEYGGIRVESRISKVVGLLIGISFFAFIAIFIIVIFIFDYKKN